MIDLALQTAVDLPTEPATTADTLRTGGDIAITYAAVKAAGMVGRRGVMGYYTNGRTVDVDAARTERDPKAVVVLAVAYAVGVALTTAAVYLTMTLALALAWAGVCAFVAAVVALQAARNATPVDDIRLLAHARND